MSGHLLTEDEASPAGKVAIYKLAEWSACNKLDLFFLSPGFSQYWAAWSSRATIHASSSNIPSFMTIPCLPRYSVMPIPLRFTVGYRYGIYISISLCQLWCDLAFHFSVAHVCKKCPEMLFRVRALCDPPELCPIFHYVV